jgi:dTMP kinase
MMFISFEGIDGSGKSTQAELLAEALGPETVLVREPGGTPVAERIRELLADPDLEIDPLAELFLFCAARADLVRRVVRPALDGGGDVIADRFVDSSVAYQGGARGLGLEVVERMTAGATEGLEPDLTLLLAVEPEIGAARSGGEDRFESEGLDLQRTVSAAYRVIAARNPERIVEIDGDGSAEEVHERVMEVVGELRGLRE